MFIRTIRAERIKLRRSPVWLAFFALPILPAVMGTFNYQMNIEILQDKWYSLWTQHTLFSCYFFIPAVIGVYCSYLWRLEHTHYNWNAAMSAPVRVGYIYLAKLIMVSTMVILTQVWTGFLFILSGKLIGLDNPIPPELFSWLFYGALGGIVISALQLFISLVIRSFAIPVGMALVGGIAGLAALAKGYGIWFPYSLISLGMHGNGPADEMQYSSGQLIISCLLFTGFFILLAIIWLGKRDVKTV